MKPDLNPSQSGHAGFAGNSFLHRYDTWVCLFQTTLQQVGDEVPQETLNTVEPW